MSDTENTSGPPIPTYSQMALRAFEAERGKKTAYSERDQLVCALSKLLPAHLERHPWEDKTWENDWRWIVFIQFPAGQACWHINDSELSWFDHLSQSEPGVNTWDGHTTEEKYERVKRLELIHHFPQRTESQQKLDEYFRNSPTFQKCISPERIQATKEAIDQIVKQDTHE